LLGIYYPSCCWEYIIQAAAGNILSKLLLGIIIQAAGICNQSCGVYLILKPNIAKKKLSKLKQPILSSRF